jgi:beta-1,4-mannosyl-glycoprotein beta-1,4-N-acetylglucosaminyltransferase
VTTYDTFLFNGELDMLEARLYELQDVPGLKHVIIEASVTHRGTPKILHYLDNRVRFAPWKDRLRHVTAFTLPVSDDPWVREHAQREYARSGLWDAAPGDVVLHGDVDEIPSTDALGMIAGARVPLDEPVVLGQRHFMYACDWEYPAPFWPGTIAARYRDIQGFQWLRAQRFTLPVLPGGGWHLSWMGGLEAQRRKLGQHCHLEMTAGEAQRISSGRAYREGAHHGGAQMIPVDVDETWPRWVYERKCPESLFRPRESVTCG